MYFLYKEKTRKLYYVKNTGYTLRYTFDSL